MKIKHKFSFTPRNKRNNIYNQKPIQNSQRPNQIKKIQLEEPKEESFNFLSPRKSTKIKYDDEDDIYKTEMNNKKPLELFQEIKNDIIEKTIDLKQKINININNYDCDNNNLDKSNISESFSKIIQNQNNSNDKIDETNNSTYKCNTMNTMEESKNNIEKNNLNKLKRFCKSMIIRKKDKEKIKNSDDKNQILINIDNINNCRDLQNYNFNQAFYFSNLINKKNGSKYYNIKAKLIKRTPRNNTYNFSHEKLNEIFNKDSNDKMNLQFNSTYNTNRTYSSMYKNDNKMSNNQYENSIVGNKIHNIKSFSYSKFIYKKRIIKKDINHFSNNKLLYKEENNEIINKSERNNKLSKKNSRKNKEMINTFRLNTKTIKAKESKDEHKFESKKEKPVNLKNTNFYSNIYKSLLDKQKENCKNNIIIQNFNNYNLNTYNDNKNINPNFINFELYSKNNKNKEQLNKTNEDLKNKRKNIILDIKINKRCYSKDSVKRNKNFIL